LGGYGIYGIQMNGHWTLDAWNFYTSSIDTNIWACGIGEHLPKGIEVV